MHPQKRQSMQLANLDNEVFFKKVFTDPEVFRAFVRDVAGVDVPDAKIETEKELDRKVAAIRFKLDIYAESKDKRVLIEIQRIDYDYSFDRFLHYFLASLVDLQRSSKNYAFQQDVYTIILLTAPYIVKDKTGKVLQDDVLVSDLNPRTLEDKVRNLYPHRLIFLNPNHISDNTPVLIKDWLDLISESIKNPDAPRINLQNPAIQKAARLANIEDMPESVLEEGKIAEMRKAARVIYEDIGRAEERAKAEAEKAQLIQEARDKEVQTIVKMRDSGIAVADIAGFMDKTPEEIMAILAAHKA
jgi:predicted transposase/invertase (TIGR01784 family)